MRLCHVKYKFHGQCSDGAALRVSIAFNKQYINWITHSWAVNFICIRVHENGTHVAPIIMIIIFPYRCDSFPLIRVTCVRAGVSVPIYVCVCVCHCSDYFLLLNIFLLFLISARADSAENTTKSSIQDYLSNIATDPNERNRYVRIHFHSIANRFAVVKICRLRRILDYALYLEQVHVVPCVTRPLDDRRDK